MVLTGAHSRITVAALIIASVFCVQPCFAETSQTFENEPFTSTDHPVGDTLAQGIACVLNPVYLGLSTLYFWVAEPEVPEHVISVRMMEPSSESHEHVEP